MVLLALREFSTVCCVHTVEGFSVVSEAEVDVSLELLYFLHDPENVSKVVSGSLTSLKPSSYIWKFLVHLLLKPGLKDFEHNLAGMWNECSCMIFWTFLGITFLWDWNENWYNQRKQVPITDSKEQENYALTTVSE